jgi:hypothetical protein
LHLLSPYSVSDVTWTIPHRVTKYSVSLVIFSSKVVTTKIFFQTSIKHKIVYEECTASLMHVCPCRSSSLHLSLFHCPLIWKRKEIMNVYNWFKSNRDWSIETNSGNSSRLRTSWNGRHFCVSRLVSYYISIILYRVILSVLDSRKCEYLSTL